MFQGNKKTKKYFEGWYFKMVSQDEQTILSVIPGISISEDGSTKHAFIQIINGKTAETEYINFSIEDFYYSKDDFFMIVFSLLLNFSICLLKYFLNIFLKKRKKHKLPKTIVVILIIKPVINPKQKLDARIIIKPPGKEKVKNKNENKKYNIKDNSRLFLINKSN